MWIARGETSRFRRENDEKGIVIPWCDQLRVLCHGSIGAFWSHCGWNSTKEGAYAGVPMLTFPIFWDQVPNSKMIVEDWKMGRRVRVDEGILVTRDEIAKLVKSFMDEDNEEGKEMRKRAREIKKICQQATIKGGSAQIDIDLFIRDILNSRNSYQVKLIPIFRLTPVVLVNLFDFMCKEITSTNTKAIRNGYRYETGTPCLPTATPLRVGGIPPVGKMVGTPIPGMELVRLRMDWYGVGKVLNKSPTTLIHSTLHTQTTHQSTIKSLMADSITTTSHLVAIPYPGRGHINPMINLCNLISLRRPSDFLITIVVTEEWLGFIGSDPKPANVHFATIPNVIPSELNRASDFPGFIKSVQTNLEDPVEKLLRRMEVPATVIVYDTYLMWMLDLGRRLDIPVASFFTMSATVFSMCYHHDLILRNGHVGDDFSEKADEVIDYIPGVPPLRVADLVTGFNGKGKEVFPVALKAMLMADKAQFLLFVSVYELEDKVIEALKSELSVHVYAIGPSIPYFKVQNDQNTPVRKNDQNGCVYENDQNTPNYLKWLDRQPEASVLYISQGSFLSVSNEQLEEIVAGVHESGVRYVWVARGETSRFRRENDEKGLVIPWCDQLRVLCHGSVGAFWSHCGWNSTKEGAYAGCQCSRFPYLLIKFQIMIVEDWKMGRRVRVDEGILVARDEIAKLIKSFMDEDSEEGKEMRKRAREIKKICRQATNEGGSAQKDIDLFISDILNSRNN
ncbi:LOW QUALITY PROTEIN: hypothetical protein OSB04_023243 [Centaurea solstitialis]|uniref:Uncharacterized protein n=1 Tax=Centaurea solstitialis TaxID=347529 RepID=A0AA38SVL1_9ASTR|nr:LOW QUALITY PROTEIN: hypothetical protein OSB04_023243 [Centaurea solstitialis]